MTELHNLYRSRDDRQGVLPAGPAIRADSTERTTLVVAPRADVRFPATASGVLIKAQPARDGRSCKFMLNREVLPGYSWRFDGQSRAQGSPLASALFELREVRAVNVCGFTVGVEVHERLDDWRPLATAIGGVLRMQLEAAGPAIAPHIIADMPSERALRETLQRAIDEEINPGLAGHGGMLSLVDVQGNTIYLHMGGGCQGCVAAEDTLRFGIDEVLRRWAPQIGLILDATEHASGQNPYYTTRE